MVICTISKGDYPITISWMLNGQNVNTIDGITATSTNKRVSQLTIESARASHTGEYTCTAENSAGTASFSAYLNVNGI